MKIAAILLFLLQMFHCLSLSGQTIGSKCLACFEFDSLNTVIRDGSISKPSARQLFVISIKKVKSFYFSTKQRGYDSSENFYPLKGYSYRSIGGLDAKGYISKGYSYFDGNKHTAHPALDIFVRDANQDLLDDLTNQPVPVLSFTGGIVVARAIDWDTLSNLRGGNYIYIYDPIGNQLIYYAHNSKVLVNVGDIVQPGAQIAYVGRSGLNAYKKRSPTHLHIMALRLTSSGLPEPYNLYTKLKKARLK